MKDLKKAHENIDKKFKDIKNFEYKETENYIMISMPKTTKAPEWFLEWNKSEFQPLKKDVVDLKKDMVDVKKDIESIKNCPTIRKELEDHNK